MKSVILLDSYENVYNPTIQSTQDVLLWLNQIKHSDYSERIQLARKEPKGSSLYDSTKKSLPCVTYNFNFNKSKKNSNIIASTGLLYIDIDDESFNHDLLDKQKVFACYKSFGGKGFGILVRVDGVTLNNYKDTYISIIEQLDLMNYYDKGAVKATQYNVLSYDNDIFINVDSFIFSSVINDPKPYVREKKQKTTYTQGVGSFSETLKFNDIDNIPIQGDYEVFCEGIDIVKCFIPMKKVTINKNNTLLAYCNNLVYLNPQLSFDDTIVMIQNVNDYMCFNPVSVPHIERIVKSVFKYKEDGTLQPIVFNKKRKVIFNKEFKAEPLEKFIIAGNEMNKLKSASSKQKLYKTLEDWNFESLGKITQSKVIKASTLCRNTVQKYWGEFNEYVIALNNENTTSKLSVKQFDESISPDYSISKLNPLEGLKMSDEVKVMDFVTQLYKQLEGPLDVESIVNFSYLVNKSYCTINEVIKTLVIVFKENRYLESKYRKITVPKELLVMIHDNKEKLMVA